MQAVSPGRLESIDALRGLVMALMLVDHVREFFFLHLQVADPMQLATTPPGLFFTRLASHVCAPVFVLLTGLGAWLYGSRPGRGRAVLSRYLALRGLLLVVLELSLVNFAWTFRFPPAMVYLQVIWVIGLSMLALAVLLWLPAGLRLVLALAIIAGHNLLDGGLLVPESPGFMVWAVLHVRQVFEVAGVPVRTSYPLLPWIGVILLGYGLGPWFAAGKAALERQRGLVALGVACLLVFGGLRALNGYGDQPRLEGLGGLPGLMSFFNLTKYPPSLLFILLTLGMGLLLLAWLDGRRPWHGLLVFGRVPLFFYVLHLYALHLLHLACTALWGATQGSRYGFDQIWQIWALAACSLLALYKPCAWMAALKQRSRAPWLSYF
jgi:uncharacterized membrane protein